MPYEDGRPDSIRVYQYYINYRQSGYVSRVPNPTYVHLVCGCCGGDKELGQVYPFMQNGRRVWCVKINDNAGSYTMRWMKGRRGRSKPKSFDTKAEAVQAIIRHHRLPRSMPRNCAFPPF
jgi:hypothetical protein